MIRRSGVHAVVLLLLLGGCAGALGRPLAAPPGPPPVFGHRTGDCLEWTDQSEPITVGCDEPHPFELVSVAEVTGPDPQRAEADTPDIRRACLAAPAGYLGSPDAPAARFEVFLLWPNERRWAEGEHWRACAVAERSSTGDQVRRTGVLAGVLGTPTGWETYHRCLVGAPSDPGPNRVVPCSEPHRSEAVPGVLNLGAPTDPPPTQDTVVTVLVPHCNAAVAAFLGGDRPGIRPAGQASTGEDWANGSTAAVCYAVSDTPVTGTSRGR